MPSVDPHAPLRDDVRLLGELLGETLRQREGQGLFETVERVRALAKVGRAGTAHDLEALAGVLRDLPVESAQPVARAFSHFLTLANIAEQHHRVRRRRDYLRNPQAGPQPASCEETFPRLMAGGVDPDALFDAVRSLQIELVLTAHPTEITRRTLIHKHLHIDDVLMRRDRPDLTVPERAETVEELRREIASAWETEEIRPRRPDPLDEVTSGLLIFEQTLWDALPRYLRSLDAALRKATGRALPLDAAPIRFGSWIGGDRDGNPYVTAGGDAGRLSLGALAGHRALSPRGRRAAAGPVHHRRDGGAARPRRRGPRALSRHPAHRPPPPGRHARSRRAPPRRACPPRSRG